jgi:hypothetical protein
MNFAVSSLVLPSIKLARTKNLYCKERPAATKAATGPFLQYNNLDLIQTRH